MANQLFYEDVDVGSEIMSLRKLPTRRQLVQWAGASEDFYEIHYDKDFAQRSNLKDVIVHGRLKASFLGQMMTDWIGEEGRLTKLTCSYRSMDFPDEDFICRGNVTGKCVKDGDHCVECEIWTENPKADRTTLGTAVVVLPSKG